MAELTTRRRGEYIKTILKILSEHPEGFRAKDVLAEMGRRLPPTSFESADFPNRPGTRRFEKYIRFTSISPVKYGWITKNKGLWMITEEGRSIAAKFTDPEALGRENERLWQIWKANQPQEPEIESDSETTRPAIFSTVEELEEAEEAAFTTIAEHLTTMPPFEFQKLIAALLRGMGYFVDWVSPPGPDEGVDIIAYTEPLGARGPRLKVQVKRRSDRVGFEELRSFLSTLGDNDRGLFVATGGFTSDAEARARGQEKRVLTLINLERLFDLWVEHYEKIEETDRRRLPLKPIYYLALGS